MRRTLRTRGRKAARFFVFSHTVFYILTSAAILPLLLLPLIPIGLVVVDGVVGALVVFSELNVTLTYVHSVELYRVVEKYSLSSCDLRLVELEWAGFGAGMSSASRDLASEGLEWRPSRGAISKANAKLRESVVIAAKYMLDPRLFIGGEEVSIREKVVLRACHRVSLLELAARYVELALLKGSRTLNP